jgi:hypothetical protein
MANHKHPKQASAKTLSINEGKENYNERLSVFIFFYNESQQIRAPSFMIIQHSTAKAYHSAPQPLTIPNPYHTT